MLGLSRSVPKRVTLPLTRTLAQVVPVNTKGTQSSPPVPVSKKAAVQVTSHTSLHERVPVKEDHGLWALFRRKEGKDLVGEARHEVIEHPSKVEQGRTGRAWRASELRLKSFEDLHTLWYVVLRERNLLATQKEEARRMGVSDTGLQVSAERVHQCRKTMARIKAVLNERRLAYEGAMKLIEEQKQKDEDEIVLQYQREQHEEERKRILSRRDLMKRRREAQRKKDAELLEKRQLEAEAQQTNAEAEIHTAANAATSSNDVSANITPESTEAPTVQTSEVAEREEKHDKSETKMKNGKAVQRKTPVNPADAAADGLFGAASQSGRRS
ncbi:hypothetical protein AX17_006200 [Amanita inopinata Kibby_2008]|nr:hypothetical protein AX17_006200 [Amanita inopinata Kibby_2008]